jgi:hypothetical protein
VNERTSRSLIDTSPASSTDGKKRVSSIVGIWLSVHSGSAELGTTTLLLENSSHLQAGCFFFFPHLIFTKKGDEGRGRKASHLARQDAYCALEEGY